MTPYLIEPMNHEQVPPTPGDEVKEANDLELFFLNRLDTARRHLVSLLSVDPDYAMDPFLVPPAAVAFFDGVKRDNEALLERTLKMWIKEWPWAGRFPHRD